MYFGSFPKIVYDAKGQGDKKVVTNLLRRVAIRSNVRENTQKLNAWLASSNYTATGPAIEAAYNGPMTLPMFRRNEIMVPIK